MNKKSNAKKKKKNQTDIDFIDYFLVGIGTLLLPVYLVGLIFFGIFLCRLGIIKYAAKGYFRGSDVIVCTLTGHGLKDPGLPQAVLPEPRTVLPDVDAVAELLQL